MWLIVVHFEGGDEGFLGNLHFAELTHLLFALFLLVEEFAFTADVAAIAFGGYVLAQRAQRFARDNLAANGCLDRES